MKTITQTKLISGGNPATGKKWERAAVMRFKQELDEHDAKTLE